MAQTFDSDDRPAEPAHVDVSRIRTSTDFAAGLAALTRRQVRGLAEKSGVARSTISSWTTGQHLPNPNQIGQLRRLLAAVGVSDEEQTEWADAVLRVRRSPGSRSPSRIHTAPFLGLAPFAESDADRFVGREDVVAAIVDHVQMVRRQPSAALRMVFLVGASGEGKSSVLSAGVSAALTAMPGTSVSLVSPSLDGRAAFAGLGPDHTLIVDQLEAAFMSDHEGAAFIEAMIEAAAGDGGPVVVAAVRSDFYHRLVGLPALNQSLVEHQVVLSPMDRDAMRRAIVEPAQRAGVEIEPGLVEMMLSDVAPAVTLDDRPTVGVLPLLSHALLETWTAGDRESLKVADYVSIGGLHGAIEKTAEVTFATLDGDGADAARDLFRRLVSITPDGLITRRHAGLDEIAAADDGTGILTSVMWQFVAARLLTVEEATLTLSHEVLLRAWSRLRAWVAEDRDDIQLHRELAAAAAAWSESDGDDGGLLAGARLERARTWLASPVGSRLAGPSERRFIEAAEDRARRRSEQDRRRFRGVTALAIAASALAIVASVATIDASNNRHAAQDARVGAEVRDLVNRSRATADPYVAAFYALEATNWTGSPLTVARSAWFDATRRIGRQQLLRSGFDVRVDATALDFRPDGAMLAVLDRDGVVHLVDPESRSDAARSDPTGTGSALGWSPDGRRLVTAGSDGMVRLFDAEQLGRPTIVADVAVTTANDVVWSPDGSTIAVTNNEGELLLLDGRTLASEGSAISTGTGAAQRAAWHPDGSLVATTNFDGSVMVIDPDDATLVAAVRLAGGVVANGLAWNPAGTILAVTSSEGFVRYFETRSLRQIGPPHTTGSSFAARVVWSPDGSLTATVNQDGTLMVFDSLDHRPIGDPILTGEGGAVAVAWSPAGDLVATANEEGIVRFFDLPLRDETSSLYGARAALSPDGERIMTTNFDDTIRTYETATSSAVGDLASAGGTDLTAVAWSPNGADVAVGSATGGLTLLDAERRTPRFTAGAGTSDAITWIGWSGDASLVFTASRTGRLAVHDADGLGLLSDVDLGVQITGGGLDPRSEVIAVTAVDGSLRLLDADDLESRSDPIVTGTAESMGLDWSPDGERLATVDGDGTVRLIDPSDGSSDADYTLPDPAVRVAWAPAGDLLAVGMSTGAIALFTVPTLELIGSLSVSDREVTTLDWTPDGTTLVSSHANGFTVRSVAWSTTDACTALRSVLSTAQMDRLVDIPDSVSACRSGTIRDIVPLPATGGRTP